MDWSPQQDAALSAVWAWLADPNRKQVFRLFGVAGTGKTALAKHFAANVDGRVLFAAYTGKAASVMRAHGCEGASTIHRLIYKPAPKSEVRLLELRGHLAELRDGDSPDEVAILKVLEEIAAIEKDLKRPSFTLNYDSQLKGAALLILDEVSMCNEEIGRDLLNFGAPLLVIGDPAQLAPVRGEAFFAEGEPDVMLTEIHRQALDSPIIQLAMAVREGRELMLGSYGDSLVVSHEALDKDSVMHHNQILVGRNITRRTCNNRARVLLGHAQDSSPLPVVGDRLVCLRNDHQAGLLNGELWDTTLVSPLDDNTLLLEVTNEEGAQVSCEAHKAPFEGRELGYWERRSAQEFDYGYALTVHKAQGSQWGSVIVFDESRFFKADRRRWLYSALTRAMDRVTVVVGV